MPDAMPDTSTYREAIDVVAHRFAADLIKDGTEMANWGNYPDIGEFDWWAVEIRAAAIAATLRPHDAAYDAAYAHLAGQADDRGPLGGQRERRTSGQPGGG
jgi:hypothetical protein